MKNELVAEIAVFAAVLLLASLFGTVFALTYENTNTVSKNYFNKSLSVKPLTIFESDYVNDTGSYTTAWAGITENINPITGIVVSGTFTHASGTPGSQGYPPDGWYEYDSFYKETNSQGQWIGGWSETQTSLVLYGPIDAAALASLMV